jgi:hypothetical protein
MFRESLRNNFTLNLTLFFNIVWNFRYKRNTQNIDKPLVISFWKWQIAGRLWIASKHFMYLFLYAM